MKFEMEISPETEAIIRDNMAICGLEDMKDYFENAFCLINCAILEANRGRKIGVINEKDQEFGLINLPIINELADKRNK